jgi:3-methyladenine DNA glycosylase AlkD
MDLKELADPVRARHSLKFFKTEPGQYGAGDLFLGQTVPQCRAVAKKYKNLPLTQVVKLLHSKFHEERLVALLILIYQSKTNPDEIYKIYLKNTKYINNWDLVDTSAPHIIGMYLQNKSPKILLDLADSPNIWERRIAIISTLAFTYYGNPEPTLQVSEKLINDKEDLIHKAVGWMLREVGKRVSQETEENFLKKHYKSMPRTMLRYAIERFSPSLRVKYLRNKL